MEKQPIISVCIPIYSSPEELKDAVHSVTLQLGDKLKDKVEIVLSHDRSSHDSQRLQDTIDELVAKWDNIRYFKNDKQLKYGNALKVNTYAKGEYLVLLSDDDYLTEFSITNLIEIIEKTNFDLLLHKPIFTPDIHLQVPKTPNTYTVYQWAKAYVNGLYKKEKEYKNLISYFSFNSVMVVRASYRKESYANIEMLTNQFPQEYPPYYDLKDKIIVLADAAFVKARILNTEHASLESIEDLKTTMDYIENQNDLELLASWKSIKRICINGWTRMIYLWIIIKKLHLDYRKKWPMRRLYFLYKKYFQK